MKGWLLVLAGVAAALLLTVAAPSRSDAGWSVGVGGGVYVGPGWYGPYYGPPYYGPYYDPYYDPWYYPPREYYPDYGYLQTTIGPDTAEVWVDGDYYGIARDFDGYSGNLKLSSGDHDAQFRMPGYKTYTVSFTIIPGGTTAVDYDLVPLGKAPPGTERRD